jgi:predicted alpha/beta superfamily hydrolase
LLKIKQNSEERLNEYCPWKNGEYSKKIVGKVDSSGGKGKEYIDFIAQELKPIIDGKYRTIINQTYMAGISLGGLISAYAACVYPHIFRNIAVFSSAFFRNQEEIEKLLKDSDLSQLEKFYMDAGTKESKNDPAVSDEFLKSNKAIYEILKGKNINVQFKIVDGGQHHYQDFRKRVPGIFSFFCH